MKYEDIKTYAERCNSHPDHQTGIITNQMITDRLFDEIEELRGLIEAKSKPLTGESIGEVAIQDTQYHGYAMAIKPHIQVALEEGTKLYTAPPQRKPLTNEELDALAIDEDGLPNSHFEFARAIERAHGIGGEV